MRRIYDGDDDGSASSSCGAGDFHLTVGGSGNND